MLTKEQIAEYNRILDGGLSKGLGNRGDQVCIEAAVCQVLGLDHGDDPKCVASSVRSYKISLNDSNWSSPIARANGLRKLGLAQLGSFGVVNNIEFASRLAMATGTILISTLFEECYSTGFIKLVTACKNAKNLIEVKENCKQLAQAAAAAYFAHASASSASDRYLLLSAELALQILKDLNSPGCALLED